MVDLPLNNPMDVCTTFIMVTTTTMVTMIHGTKLRSCVKISAVSVIPIAVNVSDVTEMIPGVVRMTTVRTVPATSTITSKMRVAGFHPV